MKALQPVTGSIDGITLFTTAASIQFVPNTTGHPIQQGFSTPCLTFYGAGDS